MASPSASDPVRAASDQDPLAADPAQTQTTPELEGAPLVPAEAREELLALKAGTTFVCARPDGDIRTTRASGEGLYARDTRHLSELRLTVGGSAPVLLSSSMQSGHHAVINATNPRLRSGGIEVPQETLNVRRTVLIADRLYYRVRLRNFHAEPVATTVELLLGADFADVFEVRGMDRRTRGRVLAPARHGDAVRFGYEGEDGERRKTLVEFEPAGARIEHRWAMRLASGGTCGSRRERQSRSSSPSIRGYEDQCPDAANLEQGRGAARASPPGLGGRVCPDHDRQRAV